MRSRELPLKQDGHDGKTQEWDGSPVLSFYVGRSVPGNGDSQAHSGLVGASAENRILWRVESCLTWATRAPLRGDKEPPGVSDSGETVHADVRCRGWIFPDSADLSSLPHPPTWQPFPEHQACPLQTERAVRGWFLPWLWVGGRGWGRGQTVDLQLHMK